MGYEQFFINKTYQMVESLLLRNGVASDVLIIESLNATVVYIAEIFSGHLKLHSGKIVFPSDTVAELAYDALGKFADSINGDTVILNKFLVRRVWS